MANNFFQFQNRLKFHLWGLLLGFLLIFQLNLNGQTSCPPIQIFPNSANACSLLDSTTVIYTNTHQEMRTGAPVFMTVMLPSSGKIRYKVGSVSGSSSAGAVTEFNVSNDLAPVFRVPTPAFLESVVIKFATMSACDVASLANGDLPRFTVSVNQTGAFSPPVSPLNITQISEPFNVQNAVISIQTPGTAFVGLGASFFRAINVSNTGYGSIDNFTFKDTTQNGATLLGLKVNGINVPVPTPVNTTLDGLPAKVYTITASGLKLGSDLLLTPGETIIVQELYQLNICGTVKSQLESGYACPGANVNCNASQTSFIINTDPGVPSFTNRVLSFEKPNGSPMRRVVMSFKNDGTPNGPNTGMGTDVRLNFGFAVDSTTAFAGEMPLSNFKINGVSVVAVLQSNKTFTVTLSQLLADPDGAANGLTNFDGDGKFDDLLLGDSLVISFDYKAPDCNADYKNRQLKSSAAYDNKCHNAARSMGGSFFQFRNILLVKSEQTNQPVVNGYPVTTTFKYKFTRDIQGYDMTGVVVKWKISDQTYWDVNPTTVTWKGVSMAAYATKVGDTTFVNVPWLVAMPLNGELSFDATNSCDINISANHTFSVSCGIQFPPPAGGGMACVQDAHVGQVLTYSGTWGCGSYCYGFDVNYAKLWRQPAGFTNQTETTPLLQDSLVFYVGDRMRYRNKMTAGPGTDYSVWNPDNLPLGSYFQFNMPAYYPNTVPVTAGIYYPTVQYANQFGVPYEFENATITITSPTAGNFSCTLNKAQITSGPRDALEKLGDDTWNEYKSLYGGGYILYNYRDSAMGAYDYSLLSVSQAQGHFHAPTNPIDYAHAYKIWVGPNYPGCNFPTMDWKHEFTMIVDADFSINKNYKPADPYRDRPDNIRDLYYKEEWYDDLTAQPYNIGYVLDLSSPVGYARKYQTYQSGYVCGSYQPNIKILYPRLHIDKPKKDYSTICTTTLEHEMGSDGKFGQVFPNEFRAPFKIRTLKATIPPGYSVVPGTAQIWYILNGVGQWVNIANPSPMTGTIVFTNPGTWPLTDDGAGFLTGYKIKYDIVISGAPQNVTYQVPYVFDTEYHNCPPSMPTIILRDTFTLSEAPPAFSAATYNKLDFTNAQCSGVFIDYKFVNTSASAAQNAWLAFESPSSVVVDNVVNITANSQLISGPVNTHPVVAQNAYGTNDRFVKLGTLQPNEIVVYRVFFRTFSCKRDSLRAFIDWGCAYPAGNAPVFGSPTIKTAISYFEQLKPGIQTQNLTPQPNITLCDAITYEFEIKNTKINDGYNVRFNAKLPPGLRLLPATVQFRYPGATGAYTSLAGANISTFANATAGDSVQIRLAQFDSPANACGLKGAGTSAANSVVRIRFNAAYDVCPDPLASRTIKFDASLTDYCQDTIFKYKGVTQPIKIAGETPAPDNIFAVVFNKIDTLHGCSTGTFNSDIEITVANNGNPNGNGGTTIGQDSIEITLPPNTIYGGMTMNISGTPLTNLTPRIQNYPNNVALIYQIPAGIVVGGNTRFKLKMQSGTGNVPACGTSLPIAARALSFNSPQCAAKGLNCTLKNSCRVQGIATATVPVKCDTAIAPPTQLTCGGLFITVPYISTTAPTFRWTNDNPAIGLPASGVGQIGTFLAVNMSPNDTIVANITIIPVNGMCEGQPKSFKIKVCPPIFSLGNRVFRDLDNSGDQSGATDPGFDGVVMILLNPDFTPFDGNPNLAGVQQVTQTTANGGYYRFDMLRAGDYRVGFLPANFAVGGALYGFYPSNGPATEANPNLDVDKNNNILPGIFNGYYSSGIVSLGNNYTEPILEGDLVGLPNPQANVDNLANMTVDFAVISLDLGDLPDTYQTLVASGGAIHVANNKLYLGACVDAELDGQPNAMAGLMAGGDDGGSSTDIFGTCAVAGDDENGVIFETPLIPGYPACLRITAKNTTAAAAKLQGWIDFNGNGTFEAAELLAGADFPTLGANIPVGGVANQQFCFNVPASATFLGGNAFLRFRLSPNGGLSSGGPATTYPIGEVEDYKLPLAKIGNLVWNDYDNNGQQNEPANAGINGVLMNLLFAGPDGDFATTADNRTFTTNTATINGVPGKYLFCGLTPGSYKVSIPTNPNQGMATQLNMGSDVSDSDDSAGELVVIGNPITLPLGENSTGDEPGLTNGFPDLQDNLTIDFGFIFLDFGDLPDSYGTTGGPGGNGGPKAVINPNLYIGACADSETNGTPSPMAGLMGGGDDGTPGNTTVGNCNGGGDETGIVFETPLIPGYPACIRVTANNTLAAAAILQGWIDFNGNGMFEANEQLTTLNFAPAGASIPVGGVVNVQYCFDVPASAVFAAGNVFARFRISPTGGLGSGGPATPPCPIGEVEDYKVVLAEVGNLVWNDYDNNGQQNEPAAAGINGVLMQMIWAGSDGNFTTTADNGIFTTTTATILGVPGKYHFTGMTPGSYKISIPTNPNQGMATQLNMGSDVSDSDDSAGELVVIGNPISLPLGENSTGDTPGNVNNYPDIQDNLTVDFGFIFLDFGDLPDTYGTTGGPGGNGGPKAVINPNLYIGACADSETNGTPSPMAGLMGGGDDGTPGTTTVGNCNGGGDETGIVFETPLIPGYPACIRVTANNTLAAAAVLQGWIDFNGNGMFEANEQLTTLNFAPAGASIPVGGVVNVQYCFDVPASAVFAAGNVFARFRISPTGGLGSGGPATPPCPIGEIEDYKLVLAKVGNLVWNDYNNDGQQNEPDSAGINGVNMQMVWAGADGNFATTADNRTFTTTTATILNVRGKYQFCGLTSGMYKISIPSNPGGFIQTVKNVGSDVSDSDDSNGEMVVINNPINLPLGENSTGDTPGMVNNFPDKQDNLTFDFGFISRDFGDLPDTYGTMTATNGPNHVLNPNLYLGACVDAETNGQPDAMAGQMMAGDDNSVGSLRFGACEIGNDDENGLVFETPLIPGNRACVRINAHNTLGAAMLQLWIDFNGNGTLEPAEQILTGDFSAGGLAVPMGGVSNLSYCFDVPATATYTGGRLFSRVRISPAGGLLATGPSSEPYPVGEIEDYSMPLGLIGNYVWMDTTLLGDQDAAEMSLANVGIKLRWTGLDGIFGNADDRFYNTTTNNLGRYEFRGLCPGNYRVIPLKYDGVANPTTTAPIDKILTYGNQAPTSDLLDSDGTPNIEVSVPDFKNAFFPMAENGLVDNNGLNGFPDNQENLTFDLGFITEPKIGGGLVIMGVAKASDADCNNFDLIAQMTIKTLKTIPLKNIQATLDLDAANAFGTMFKKMIGLPVILTSSAQITPTLNATYDGSNIANIFAGNDGSLWPNDSIKLQFRFLVQPKAAGAPSNPKMQGFVSGTAVNFNGQPFPDYFNGGIPFVATDSTDNGLDDVGFNPDQPGDFGTEDDPTPLTDCWKQAQTPTAHNKVNVSMDANCEALITPEMILQNEHDDCVLAGLPLGGYYEIKSITTMSGEVVPNPVTKQYLNQMLIVSVGGITGCNTAWGKIQMEDKTPPTIVCNDIHINCAVLNRTPDYLKNTLGITFATPTITENCMTTTSSYSDSPILQLPCNDLSGATAKFTRNWTVTDAAGLIATCEQCVYIDSKMISDVKFPANLTISCENPNTNPSETGVPYITDFGVNFPIYGVNTLCDLAVEHDDQVISICPSSYKIIRKWTIVDWCKPILAGSNPFVFEQIIKVLDETAPVLLDCPADFSVSIDPTACTKTLDLPTISVQENCSDIAKGYASFLNPKTLISQTVSATFAPDPNWTGNSLVNFGTVNEMPIGENVIVFNVEDGCGNVGTCSVVVTVFDGQPPVAICQQITKIALGDGHVTTACGSSTNALGSAFTELPAESFNSNSYDICGEVFFKVRRMDGGACSDANFGDKVNFCCSDIDQAITVVFRVYDVDPGVGFIATDALEGHYNDCMVTVLVEDKEKPICLAPAAKTVNCDEFDPLLWYGDFVFIDNCGIKSVDSSVVYVPNQITFEQCNYGQVRRTFTVKDCSGNSSRCTQTITVNYKENYRVYFPDDKNLTQCGALTPDDKPQIFGENCELLGISHEDQVFDVVPDACYKVLRTWKIINWCTFNPNLAEVEIPNSTTSTQGARVWIGDAFANYNANSPEISTVLAKIWTYPQPLTGTVANQNGSPAYKYTQIIKVIDATPPQVNLDPILGTASYNFCDYSANDPQQWNFGAATYDPTNDSHDLCEGTVDLQILGTDDCTGDNVNFRYLLFLDLNGDGVMETTINSDIPTLGFGIREDELVEINGIKYRIGRVTRDIESDDPNHDFLSNFQLPLGNHKIKWILEDRCGNDFSQEFPIEIKDCKNPTVVCLNGLAVNSMNAAVGTTPAGVTLWAIDFLKYAEDNCTNAADLEFAIRDEQINPGTGFPIKANGDPQNNLTWDCSQLGTNGVQLWARDKAGNADFCWSYLILTDNTDACGLGISSNIAGVIKTVLQDGVSETNVQLAPATSNPAFPAPTYFTSKNDGTYNFTGIPIDNNYSIVPLKDVNPLNGVSTFDVVIMSKHMLNIAPFTTPNQFIAADINHNGVVTTADIVELRKLILGIYSDFPKNTSWRFYESSYNFTSANPAGEAFPEFSTIAQLQNGTTSRDFTAVKIGDLTGDAISNNLMQADDRDFDGLLHFGTENQTLIAGEPVEIAFTAKDFNDISGFQFTLEFDISSLELLEIMPDARMKLDNFGTNRAQNGLLTASWNDAKSVSFPNGEVVFILKMLPKKSGLLSQLLRVSSRVTAAEAYQSASKRLDLTLDFSGKAQENRFELYQNRPNPFNDRTIIGFEIPESTTAMLTITDVNGRILQTIKGDYRKGYHEITVVGRDFPTGTLLYYRLDTPTNSAVKLMARFE